MTLNVKQRYSVRADSKIIQYEVIRLWHNGEIWIEGYRSNHSTSAATDKQYEREAGVFVDIGPLGFDVNKPMESSASTGTMIALTLNAGHVSTIGKKLQDFMHQNAQNTPILIELYSYVQEFGASSVLSIADEIGRIELTVSSLSADMNRVTVQASTVNRSIIRPGKIYTTDDYPGLKTA